MQKIKTKNYGIIEFVKTWVDGNIHIGKCTDGSYRHIGGPPVIDRRDLTVIPFGSDREAAEAWFDGLEAKREDDDTEGEEGIVEETKPVIVERATQAVIKTSKNKKTCHICGKEFANAVALYGHMKTHNVEAAADE